MALCIGKPEWLVVNSDYSWLQTGDDRANNLKPDLFFCHEAFYREKLKETDLARTFGGLDWCVRDCMGLLLEANMNIGGASKAPFGEVVDYTNHISYGDDGPEYGKAMLFDKTQFWLIDFVAGHPSNLLRVNWTDDGSGHVLSHFPSASLPWVSLLKEACQILGVAVGEHAYLGCGVAGRVFRVGQQAYNGSSKIPRALKLVLGEESRSVLVESRAMKEAIAKCQEHVMLVEAVKYFTFTVDGVEFTGGALLLSHVGNPALPVEPKPSHAAVVDRFTRILRSLFSLHVKHVVHNDARLDNVVEVNDTFLWIDFRVAMTQTDEVLLFRDDMHELTRSMLQVDKLPNTVVAAIAKYHGKQEDELQEVTSEVVAILDEREAERKREEEHERRKDKLKRGIAQGDTSKAKKRKSSTQK